MAETPTTVRSAEAPIPAGLRVVAGLLSIPAIPLINAIVQRFADAETATLVAPSIPTTIVAFLEYVNWRRQTRIERIEAAVRGDDAKNPLLVALYIVLVLQVLQGAIAFLVGVGVGAALSPYAVAPEISQSIALTAAPFVVIPLIAAVMVFVARAAAYRLATRPIFWITAAIVVNIALNVVTALLVLGGDILRVTTADVALLLAMTTLYFVAAWTGTRWASRNRPLYRLSRAYHDLSGENRNALIDLAMTAVEPVTAGRPIETVRAPEARIEETRKQER